MEVTIDCDVLKNKKTGVEEYTLNIINSVSSYTNVNLLHDKKIKHYIFDKYDEQLFNLPKYPLSRFINSILFPQNPKTKIIHCPTPTGPFWIKPKNKKLVVTVHDITPLIFSKHHNFKRKIYYQVIVKKLLHQANKIISISETTKKDLIKFYKIPESKIKVIYHGVSIKHTSKPIPKKYKIDSEYILYVGTVEPRKNLIRLIEAYNKIKPKEKLVIVGASGWKNKDIYKKQNKNIIFTGYIPDEDLNKFYSNAKIFIYPSLYEGFGLPILEAMACKTPVITSNTSSMPEVGGDAVIYVNPTNTNDIANKLKELLNNKPLQKQLSEKGYKRSKQFTWDKTAKETIEIYRKLL